MTIKKRFKADKSFFQLAQTLFLMRKTNLSVWRNERDEADDSGVGEQLGNFSDPPDVFLPVVGRKSQILQKITRFSEHAAL